MFFLIPGGLGGIFSYIIIFLVIRLVYKSIFGSRNRTYTHYYYTNQNQYNNQQYQNAGQTANPLRKNYYSVLGLTETATDDEIKKAYRKLIMEYHPDKVANNSNMDEKYKEFAAKRFREVQEAYEEICKLRGIK